MDGGEEERKYDCLARGKGVTFLRGEGGNLCQVELDAIACAVNQGGKKTGIVRDTSVGRGGGRQSRKLPKQGGRRGASLGHGQGLGMRGLSEVERLVWEGIVHLATWYL